MIDTDLMEAAGLIDHEAVQIWNVNNGERFETYAIPGQAGSGVVCINGAAAHLVNPGDLGGGNRPQCLVRRCIDIALDVHIDDGRSRHPD